MAEPTGEEESGPQPRVMGFTVERVNALSDGVFAVAITLLGVGIALPVISGTVTNTKVAHGLAQLWLHFFAYALSFVIIAMFWLSHHSLFTVIQKVDKVIIWINIVYLLVIVFIPYATMLLSRYGKTAVVTVLYASVFAAAGILQGGMGWYAVRGHRLVYDDFDLRQAGEYLRNSFMMSGIFIISIGVAFASPTIAQFCWLALFVRPLIERFIFKKENRRPDVGTQEAA